MIPQFPVYLFDVDGTLLDSASDICGAIQQALAHTRAGVVPEATLRRYIGVHLVELFHDFLPELGAEEVDALIQSYRRIYLARQHASTRVYPGVAEGLAALGGRKSTATIKGTPTTRAVLEQFGLVRYFNHVQGTDGFPAKPKPDVIFESLKVFGAEPNDCLMVGDAPSDMAAGRAAGVKICAVRYGYGNNEELARFEPDYWIDDLRELSSSQAQ